MSLRVIHIHCWLSEALGKVGLWLGPLISGRTGARGSSSTGPDTVQFGLESSDGSARTIRRWSGEFFRKVGAKARNIHLLPRGQVKRQLAIQNADPDFLRSCLEIKYPLLLDFRCSVGWRNDFHADFGCAFQDNGFASVLLARPRDPGNVIALTRSIRCDSFARNGSARTSCHRLRLKAFCPSTDGSSIVKGIWQAYRA